MTGLILSLVGFVFALAALMWVRQRLAFPQPVQVLKIEPPLVIPKGVEVYADEQFGPFACIASTDRMERRRLAMRDMKCVVPLSAHLVLVCDQGHQHAANRFEAALRHAGYRNIRIQQEDFRHEMEGLVA